MERSLARGLTQLGIEAADVLLLGWYNGPPGDRLLERAERMREKGMFRHLAVSGHRRRAFVGHAAEQRFSVLHIRYNAAHAGAETEVFPHLPAERRPGTVAYTATCWGALLKPRRMPPGEAPLRARDCYRFVLSNPDFNALHERPQGRCPDGRGARGAGRGPAFDRGRIPDPPHRALGSRARILRPVSVRDQDGDGETDAAAVTSKLRRTTNLTASGPRPSLESRGGAGGRHRKGLHQDRRVRYPGRRG